VLKARVIAALIFTPAVLGFVVFGGLPLKFGCVALAWLMLREFLSLTLGSGERYAKVTAYLLTTVLALRLSGLLPPWNLELLLPAGVLVLFVAVLAQPLPIEASMRRSAFVLLGAAYTGGLIPYLSRLREIEQGLGFALLALFCTWGADTGAYFVGKNFGKHKLYPKVSPAKSWEGLVGGVSAGIMVAFLVRSLVRMELSIGHTVGIGVLAACLGLLGDLSESLLKRSVGAKDAGTLIPGHGGVLDRFDAVMFVAPALYIYAALLA